MRRTLRIQRLEPIIWAGGLTLLVSGPWLLPGYVFGTDFAGPRHFDFPRNAASYEALQALLWAAGTLLPSEIVAKILILAVLFVGALAAYRTVPAGGFVPRAVASLVYVVNPFVYDRLAYGQLNVLAGYAVLPWVASSVRWLLVEPTGKRAIGAAAAFVLVSILDIHLALIAAIVAGALLIAHLVVDIRDWRSARRLGQSLLIAGIAALVASSYWLAPVLQGGGPQARTLARIGTADLMAFRTGSDPILGLIPNVLGLYGFWAERTGRFASMKDFAPIWPLVLVVLLTLSAVGAAAAWRRTGSVPINSPRSWTLGLLAAGAIAVVLDIGVSDPHVASFIGWVDAVFPPYRGIRDASKWGAVLALVYSQLTAVGVMAVTGWVKERVKDGPRQDGAVALVIAIVLAGPLYYGNGILYGLHGQIRPSAYPVGWYAADRVLSADPHPGRAVFLPWHGYLALSFVRNANRVVGSPAPLFFSIPVVASEDLEIPGIPPPVDDPDQALVARLIAAGGGVDWASGLAERNFKYVLLAREVDWQNYRYLESQTGLALVGDYGSIILYRNLAWTIRR